jgi:exo-beta-1,3-glucanase (GH17 family)
MTHFPLNTAAAALSARRGALAWLLALVAALVIAACGGGGVVPATGVQQRALSADFSTRKAVAYSPYRTGNRDTEVVSAANIQQDLALLAAGNFTLLRLFDSSDAVSKLVLQTIRDQRLDMKVMLGVFIQRGNDGFNSAEKARGIKLAQDFRDIVVAVSVGNETLVNWSFNSLSSAVMAGHLKDVRDQITQPVTTDDNWLFFASKPSEFNDARPIFNAIDFVSMHSYPLLDTVSAPQTWDWQQQGVPEADRAVAMMNASIASATSEYNAVRANMDSRGLQSMPIIIGETGWKAVASNGEFNRAHPVNQQMYFERLNSWQATARSSGVGPRTIVYFEAFDEPWKGSDDKWGLFNVNRQARCMVQDLYASVTPAVTPEAGSCAASAALFPPTVVRQTITTTRYVVYADAVTADETRIDPLQLSWSGFGINGPTTAFSGEVVTGADAPYREIQPAPAAGIGWGLLAAPPGLEVDLSLFEASGSLNLRVRTLYPGKLQIGFQTGSGASSYDVYLPISSGQFGYVNDGAWHNVSIPISAIKAAGEPSFGNTPATAQLNLSKVTSAFTVVDFFAKTGKTGAGSAEKIFVDEIFWSR